MTFHSLFINGFLFMYIYIKSGNIWVGTIIHAMMNFCNGYFFNEDLNTRLSLYVLKDIQEAKALPLLLGFQVGLVVLLFVLTRISYNQKEKLESNLKNQKTFKL
jgi:membrane protease YdiL (CAAX protease family)